MVCPIIGENIQIYISIKHMWHSQIQASSNFRSNLDFVPCIGEELHIGGEFQQFSRINKYIKVPGKLSEIHLKVGFFSNPEDKVLKCKIQGDKSVPYLNKKTNNVPWIGEQWDCAMYFWQFFHAPWHTYSSWKTVETRLQFLVFLQSRGQWQEYY